MPTENVHPLRDAAGKAPARRSALGVSVISFGGTPAGGLEAGGRSW
ncbi:hypothetical protein FB570_109311 [Streptomyces sp. T12]|nr:hypothetical protein FB570_109311 [Streptomyces sp. T12]